MLMLSNMRIPQRTLRLVSFPRMDEFPSVRFLQRNIDLRKTRRRCVLWVDPLASSWLDCRIEEFPRVSIQLTIDGIRVMRKVPSLAMTGDGSTRVKFPHVQAFSRLRFSDSKLRVPSVIARNGPDVPSDHHSTSSSHVYNNSAALRSRVPDIREADAESWT